MSAMEGAEFLDSRNSYIKTTPCGGLIKEKGQYFRVIGDDNLAATRRKPVSVMV